MQARTQRKNVELLDHTPYSPEKVLTISLLSRKLKTDCVVKGSSHQKKQLTRSKMPFWICKQKSGKVLRKLVRAHADVY
ncbi:unnamed protein product [Acanthoscelides obtectus]|uniref:Uncharacterized protein n=1 Tax=Acanthoscelides obtectus TaxID=200917 RepID=A0A9P0JQ71_ACAOB|nr:unnamed protein product [Acanthoscelides obtectus]CAK1672386.1 hypothetical protein AOBTE_LOCUS28848 [Acanthoscelides obtectus]